MISDKFSPYFKKCSLPHAHAPSFLQLYNRNTMPTPKRILGQRQQAEKKSFHQIEIAMEASIYFINTPPFQGQFIIFNNPRIDEQLFSSNSTLWIGLYHGFQYSFASFAKPWRLVITSRLKMKDC